MRDGSFAVTNKQVKNMVLLQGLFAAFAHSAGKILNTIFGWATMLLFGHVTEKKQLIMSIISMGSVLWIVALIGSIFPSAGVFLVAAFVPKAVADHQAWVRLAMLAAAFCLPFVIGAITIVGKKGTISGVKGKVKQIVMGWPYTIGLALTMLLMLVFAPVMKLISLSKRWQSQHVPVLIPTHKYLTAIDDVAAALHDSGIEAQQKRASWMISLPTRVLLFFARNQLQDVVGDNLTVFAGGDFEVMLHPSDLIISGNQKRVSHLRAVLAEKLAFTSILLTWDETANAVESDLKQIWLDANGGSSARVEVCLAQLGGIEKKLMEADLEYEEWSVLSREKARIEHALLQRFLPQSFRKAS